MKYFFWLLISLIISTSVHAFTPDISLKLVLEDKIWDIEIIIEKRWEDFRDTLVSALENILINTPSASEKFTFIVTYLIDWIKNNSNRILTRADFVESYKGFEIVQVPNQILAVVTNSWPLWQNNDDAFEYLSSYIFGNNETGAEIAMTSPVMRIPLDTSSYETAFIMPNKRTMENLPRANTSRISFKEVPWSLKAVRKFSWWSSTSVVDSQRTAFQNDLNNAWITRYWLPTLSLYDWPRVAAQNRRNELWVDLNQEI